MGYPHEEKLLKQIPNAQFFMLRYETEFTPCTGITAVTKQERRNFKNGIMIAPWCPLLKRENPEKDDPLKYGKVKETGWEFTVNGLPCRVYLTTDEFAPILFLGIEGRFQGVDDPYDVPLTILREDTLYFGLAIDLMLRQIGTSRQFVWGADWESVPALVLLRHRHHISLTLHNTFDECLEVESRKFRKTFEIFRSKRDSSNMAKTALEIGLEITDAVSTVNRGFAWGMLNEPIQTKVMAAHLQHLLGRAVGIDNAAFSTTGKELLELKDELQKNPQMGLDTLIHRQKEARASLPVEVSSKIGEKVLVVSMGRRVAQKLHEVLIHSLRQILTQDPEFPLFVFFATKRGDSTSDVRLKRIKRLQKDFPTNVAFTDGQLPYYGALMKAADYNCMPSLYEPHGGAYEGTVIPIARAIDGLAEQICALNPRGEAARMNDLWHDPDDAPTGFLFRESASDNPKRLVSRLKKLLGRTPWEKNALFHDLQGSLSEVLVEAVKLRKDEPEHYVRLVLAAIEKQESTSWDENLKGMLALIEKAKLKRKMP